MLEHEGRTTFRIDYAPLFRTALLLTGYFMVSLFVLAVAGKDGPSDPTLVGKDLWQRNNCVSCHALVGLGGHIGPDLTNAFSRRGEGYIRYVLNNGSQKMPAFRLSTAEQNALIAYLKAIDSTSIYPLKSYDGPVFGQSKTSPYKH
ncbi:MAG: cytochrome c [Saprospirales bacterium]|jgi:mono/diheme cytochrome c family protein|nr:cytochrome c [Saprospirales bacterium]MBK8924291.1 cytochrome c [Saprospirales bacterium]